MIAQRAMASSSMQNKCLTEEDIRTASQQYDVALIFHASLPRQRFHQLDVNAFSRCHALQLLDLSGNKLTTLAGIEPVTAQLTFLNVAENSLRDISALEGCVALQCCHLEGNELSSVAPLKVLVTLPALSELVLQRSVPLADTVPAETLLLDNPVCRSAETYQVGFLAQVSHIRWVDGVPAFRRNRLLSASRSGSVTEQDAANATLISNVTTSLESLMQEMTRSNAVKEAGLRKLLDSAAQKCKNACHA